MYIFSFILKTPMSFSFSPPKQIRLSSPDIADGKGVFPKDEKNIFLYRSTVSPDNSGREEAAYTSKPSSCRLRALRRKP